MTRMIFINYEDALILRDIGLLSEFVREMIHFRKFTSYMLLENIRISNTIHLSQELLQVNE
jgi:hypothetical protein